MTDIILSTGGTGGHVFPAISLAYELKKRGYLVHLITDQRGATYQSSDKFNSVKILSIPKGGGVLGQLRQVLSVLAQAVKLAIEFRRNKPGCVVGFGGYTSAPVVLAAFLSGIPIIIHEQNAVLGRVNRLMARVAKKVALGMPVTKGAPESAVFVGNPVRDSFLTVNAPIKDHDTLTLFVFGGSQGADLFARIVPKAVGLLPRDLQRRIRIVHQARAEVIASVQAAYAETDVHIEAIQPFFTDMPQRISEANLIICRAGAMTVTEIAVIGRPVIFIPLKIAMDNHQYWNAIPLVEAKAAELIQEIDLTPKALSEKILLFFTDSQQCRQMVINQDGFVVRDAAQKLADLV